MGVTGGEKGNCGPGGTLVPVRIKPDGPLRFPESMLCQNKVIILHLWANQAAFSIKSGCLVWLIGVQVLT